MSVTPSEGSLVAASSAQNDNNRHHMTGSSLAAASTSSPRAHEDCLSYAHAGIANSGNVATHQLYGGSVDLLEDTFADARTRSEWADAVRPGTRAFFLESIGNPLATVPDPAATEIAHDIPLVIDNTMTTPYPLRAIDVVVQASQVRSAVR